MLKSPTPNPQTEDPPGREAGTERPAPSSAGSAARGAKAQRRYEVPESDPFDEASDRPHAQTVRGQIQRVRLDLLARENERLDHQLRVLTQQQSEYQERDSAWREGWQKRLVELSERVDHLVSEAEAAREAEQEQDEGSELRDTVKPLLLAVLEMLDDGDKQVRPGPRETARPPALQSDPPTPAGVAEPRAAAPKEAPPAAAALPRAIADPAPEAPRQVDLPAETRLAGSAKARLAAPKPPVPSAAGLAAAIDPIDPVSQDRGLTVEIARLLLPQDDAEDGLDDPLEPEDGPRKDAVEAASPSPTVAQDADARQDDTLVLGTSETPELERPRPAADSAPAAQATTARSDERRVKLPDEGAGQPAKPADGATGKPAAGAVPTAGPGSEAAGPGAGAGTPQPDPVSEVAPEPLPRCLTERWDDPQLESALSSLRGEVAQRRDKSAYRWPFRRLRATIDHDHAASPSEPTSDKRGGNSE